LGADVGAQLGSWAALRPGRTLSSASWTHIKFCVMGKTLRDVPPTPLVRHRTGEYVTS